MIVEDDPALRRTLARSFRRRGYPVAVADGPRQLDRLLERLRPGAAIVDLKLGGNSGLQCVQLLHALHPETRIVVITGYPCIATAVEAIKLGATHYLAKPVNADDIEEAFGRIAGDPRALIDAGPPSLKHWEWERISQTLAATGFNISEAARRLDMHRRTLARKLKRQARNVVPPGK